MILLDRVKYNNAEAVTGGVLQKKMFLKISQILKKNTRSSLFSIKKRNFIKKRLKQCFTVKIAKFLRASILKNIRELVLRRPKGETGALMNWKLQLS